MRPNAAITPLDLSESGALPPSHGYAKLSPSTTAFVGLRTESTLPTSDSASVTFAMFFHSIACLRICPPAVSWAHMRLSTFVSDMLQLDSLLPLRDTGYSDFRATIHLLARLVMLMFISDLTHTGSFLLVQICSHIRTSPSSNGYCWLNLLLALSNYFAMGATLPVRSVQYSRLASSTSALSHIGTLMILFTVGQSDPTLLLRCYG